MKLQHLAVGASAGATAHATLQFNEGLNAVSVVDSTTGEGLYDLVGHLVYGARVHRDSNPYSARIGYVDISSSLGRYRLERHSQQVDRGTFVEPRLTVAALDGQPARAETTRELLAGISPEVAARLFVLRSSGDAQLAWLLSEELATELHQLERRSPYETTSTYKVGDDLFAERDALSHQIEMLLSDKRRSSEAMETALRELQRESQEVEQRLEEHRRELGNVLSQLAELETQLRYRELSEFVEREADEAHHADQQPALADLDEQIAKWRRTLAELEARDAAVRHRLSQLHPDESSPLLPLADQRACVSIARRLVADLDSEVARYARPTDSQACLCQHTHARLHPLVDTLAQQIDKLAHLVEQYEAAVEVEQLKSEAEHLARSQTALRGTIDQLLDRRQSRLRTSRVRKTESLELPEDLQKLLAELDRRRSELNAKVVEGERHLADLAARGERIRRDRTELLNDSSLARLREQLESVNRRLESGNVETSRSVRSVAPWRASDILAKLTDGRLREIRLSDHGRAATVVNRTGHVVHQADLNDVDRRLVCLSLQLAAVAGTAEWGLELPLVVADPFAELPSAEASILTLVLHDWARAGHQVLLVTASQTVVDRLRSLGQPIMNLETAARQPLPLPVEPVHLAEPTLAIHEADSFALDLEDSIGRFRVLGDDTASLFAEIDIHTLAELLAADAEQVSHSLDRTGISAEVVDLWQTHVSMLVYVPNLSLAEVQLLSGGGIQNLSQLATADADELYDAIHQYLESPRGIRHRGLRSYLNRDSVRTWIADAERYRHRWENTPYASRGTRRSSMGTGSPRRRKLNGRNGSTARNGKRRASGKQAKKRTRPLRFRLSRTSPVVDAPSVGPKTAKRLGKLGIRTVVDLLEADPEATAEALDTRHISAEKIVAWQHQSQLMCRVPELLARDAQVLVGCGFTTPEGIASAEAADLYEFAKSYTATAEGTRVLRGSDPPDLERATKWVYWAENRRTLEAA